MAARQHGGIVVRWATWEASPLKFKVMGFPLPGNKPAQESTFFGQSSPDAGETLNVGHRLLKQLFVCLQESRALQREWHLSSRAPWLVVGVDCQFRLAVQPTRSTAFLFCLSCANDLLVAEGVLLALRETGLEPLGVVVDAAVLAVVLLRVRQVEPGHLVDGVVQLLHRTARFFSLFSLVFVVLKIGVSI